MGKKQRRRNAASSLGTKLPTITPTAKCKLRLLKLEHVKDWLLMEEEFVQNQEALKPADERNEEERTKVRGGPAWRWLRECVPPLVLRTLRGCHPSCL